MYSALFKIVKRVVIVLKLCTNKFLGAKTFPVLLHSRQYNYEMKIIIMLMITLVLVYCLQMGQG